MVYIHGPQQSWSARPRLFLHIFFTTYLSENFKSGTYSNSPYKCVSYPVIKNFGQRKKKNDITARQTVKNRGGGGSACGLKPFFSNFIFHFPISKTPKRWSRVYDLSCDTFNKHQVSSGSGFSNVDPFVPTTVNCSALPDWGGRSHSNTW